MSQKAKAAVAALALVGVGVGVFVQLPEGDVEISGLPDGGASVTDAGRADLEYCEASKSLIQIGGDCPP